MGQNLGELVEVILTGVLCFVLAFLSSPVLCRGTRVICRTPSVFRPWVTVASISRDFFGICRIFLDRSTD